MGMDDQQPPDPDSGVPWEPDDPPASGPHDPGGVDHDESTPGWFDPSAPDADDDSGSASFDAAPVPPTSRDVPVGLDESEFFAADRILEVLDTAAEGAQRALNLADALRVQTLLALWSAMVLDEQGRGRAVHEGGVQERAFSIHIAVRYRMSRRGALALIRDAVAFERHLPGCWAGFVQGEFSWRASRIALDVGTGLHGDALASFDAEALELLIDLAPHQLDAKLRRVRDRLDPKEAAEAADRASQRRHVNAAPTVDGQATLALHGPQTDIAAVYDVLHQAAVGAHGQEGESRAIGALMFDVAVDLVLHGAASPAVPLSEPGDPQSRLGDTRVPDRKVIQATLLVYAPAATACGMSDQRGDLAGWGGLSAEETRRIAAATSHWTRVLVDPVDDAILAFDSTERHIPNGLRRLIQARDGTCRGPSRCTVPAHRTDVDHTQRFEHHGHTTQVNLASLCRPEHNAKDEGYLHVRHRSDGTLAWRTRWGATIVTKPTITIRRPARADDPPPF